MSSGNPLGSSPMQIPEVILTKLFPGMAMECNSRPWKLTGLLTLSKCVSSELFSLKKTPLLCILLCVIPQGLICNGEEGRAHLNLDSELPCAQRAIPVLILLLVGAGMIVSTTVGTSALVMGDKSLNPVLKQT